MGIFAKQAILAGRGFRFSPAGPSPAPARHDRPRSWTGTGFSPGQVFSVVAQRIALGRIFTGQAIAHDIMMTLHGHVHHAATLHPWATSLHHAHLRPAKGSQQEQGATDDQHGFHIHVSVPDFIRMNIGQ